MIQNQLARKSENIGEKKTSITRCCGKRGKNGRNNKDDLHEAEKFKEERFHQVKNK